MKIGFPNHPRKDILKEVEWIGRKGFDFVDLFLEEDQAVPEKINTEKLKALLQKHKLETVGHTAWYWPTGSPIKRIRDSLVEEAEKYFKTFSQVGTKLVTIHSNWPPGLFNIHEGISFQVYTLRKLANAAKKYNISIMLELIDPEKDTPENIQKILKQVPGLFFHLDIGHANMQGNNPEEYIKKLHKKIRHIHLHDNYGKDDLHLPMGVGRINWKNLIKPLKKHYDGTITLEMFASDKDYALLSKKKLEELWKQS